MEGLREPKNYGLFHPFRLVGWRSQRAGRKLFYLRDHATAQAPCDYLLVLKPSLEYPGATRQYGGSTTFLRHLLATSPRGK